jgi:hypothetical protein
MPEMFSNTMARDQLCAQAVAGHWFDSEMACKE